MFLRNILLALAILPLFNCQTQNVVKDKDKVVLDLDKDKVKANQTSQGLQKAKEVLKEDDQFKIGIAKFGYSFTRSKFIEPVAKVLDVFVEESDHFDCKPCHSGKSGRGSCPSNAEEGPLFCDVKNEKGAVIMKASIGGDQDVKLHFCHIKKNAINIKEGDDKFWNFVTSIGGASFSPEAKNNLYKKSKILPLHGVTVSFEKIGEDFTVKDFRASIGPVEKGSKEYREFVDSDCLAF